jgi:S-adenosylmethionine:tRNA ribosyltransferase-isomerase
VSDLSIIKSGNSPCLEDFEYDLPLELIAQEPLLERTKSRLLRLDRNSGELQHCFFEDLVTLLRAGDTLVLNNTKVIPARLIAKRHSGGMIKMLLLQQIGSTPRIWQALVTPIKRLKPGEKLTVASDMGTSFDISVIDIETGFDGFKRLVVDLGEPENVWQLLNQAGYAPLPPYIQRHYDREPAPGEAATKNISRESDLSRYQTVFAKEPGAVAAPTAGLHFNESLLEALKKRGIDVQYLTLHVGAGTFKPIESSLEEHKVEPERFSISEQTAAAINQAKKEKRRIIAVGSTSLRALETAGASGQMAAVENGVTHLFVKPGYQFRVADGLITNFHLSKSSLLVLVSAFAGREKLVQAYREAIEKRYRFYSYGDAMLIL